MPFGTSSYDEETKERVLQDLVDQQKQAYQQQAGQSLTPRELEIFEKEIKKAEDKQMAKEATDMIMQQGVGKARQLLQGGGLSPVMQPGARPAIPAFPYPGPEELPDEEIKQQILSDFIAQKTQAYEREDSKFGMQQPMAESTIAKTELTRPTQDQLDEARGIVKPEPEVPAEPQGEKFDIPARPMEGTPPHAQKTPRPRVIEPKTLKEKLFGQSGFDYDRHGNIVGIRTGGMFDTGPGAGGFVQLTQGMESIERSFKHIQESAGTDPAFKENMRQFDKKWQQTQEAIENEFKLGQDQTLLETAKVEILSLAQMFEFFNLFADPAFKDAWRGEDSAVFKQMTKFTEKSIGRKLDKINKVLGSTSVSKRPATTSVIQEAIRSKEKQRLGEKQSDSK